MRFFFTSLLLVFFSCAYASDTLTRAEIYNFSVGDTFDYRYYKYNSGYGDSDQFISSTTISYERYIISNIFWSSDSSTKFIARKEIYPLPIAYDTIQLDNPNGYEVFMDSSLGCSDWQFQFDSLPEYFDQRTNYIDFNVCAPGIRGILFAYGLGKAIDGSRGHYPGSGWNDSIILIYYSGSHGTYGTPYTSFPTAVINIPISTEKIRVFPILSNGIFTVEPPDDAPLPINFLIYDLQGRMLRQFNLNNRKNEIDMGGLAKGMYVWKSISEGAPNQAGRIIIQ